MESERDHFDEVGGTLDVWAIIAETASPEWRPWLEERLRQAEGEAANVEKTSEAVILTHLEAERVEILERLGAEPRVQVEAVIRLAAFRNRVLALRAERRER